MKPRLPGVAGSVPPSAARPLKPAGPLQTPGSLLFLFCASSLQPPSCLFGFSLSLSFLKSGLKQVYSLTVLGVGSEECRQAMPSGGFGG